MRKSIVLTAAAIPTALGIAVAVKSLMPIPPETVPAVIATRTAPAMVAVAPAAVTDPGNGGSAKSQATPTQAQAPAKGAKKGGTQATAHKAKPHTARPGGAHGTDGVQPSLVDTQSDAFPNGAQTYAGNGTWRHR